MSSLSQGYVPGFDVLGRSTLPGGHLVFFLRGHFVADFLTRFCDTLGCRLRCACGSMLVSSQYSSRRLPVGPFQGTPPVGTFLWVAFDPPPARRIARRHRPDHPAMSVPLRGTSGTGASGTGEQIV